MYRDRWIVLSVLLILVATLMPSYGVSMSTLSLAHSDKFVHFFIFFCLGIAIHKSNNEKASVLNWSIFAVFLAVFTECAQFYIPGRNMDVVDGFFDLLGLSMAFMSPIVLK